MRLRTCVLLELVVGASTLTGAGLGAVLGFGELRHYVSLREGTAIAATLQPRPEPRAERPTPAPTEAPTGRAIGAPVEALRTQTAPPALAGEPGAEPVAAPGAAPVAVAEPTAAPQPEAAPAPPPIQNVFGTPDEELLATVRGGPITRVKVNRGGTSLSLRLDFADGGRAAFKPEQVFAHSSPRREIAAYRLDRLLGLGRVPPAEARRFSVDEIKAALDPSTRGILTRRLQEEAIARDGTLAGEVSWWVPVISDAAIRGFRIDETDGIVTWRRLLKAGAKIADRDRALVQQISDMVLFDFLIDNLDRWSGSNTKASPDGRTLYFMDNTMSFSGNRAGHERSQQYLRRSQTFSRSLVGKLRALDEDAVRAAFTMPADSPLPPLLSKNELAALLGRRDAALQYIDELIAEFGEDVVLAFP